MILNQVQLCHPEDVWKPLETQFWLSLSGVGEFSFTGIQYVEARDANYLTMSRTDPHKKELSSPNCQYTDVERT